jgi:hypothetical protein
MRSIKIPGFYPINYVKMIIYKNHLICQGKRYNKRVINLLYLLIPVFKFLHKSYLDITPCKYNFNVH